MSEPRELVPAEKNLPNSKNLEHLLREAVREVFSKMIPVELRDVDPHAEEELFKGEHRAYVESSVGLHGWCEGRVKLFCSREGAAAIAREMFQMGADEEVSDADVSEAISECATMVGGVFKCDALDPVGPLELDPPEVASFTAMIHELGSEELVWGLSGGGLSAIFHLAAPCGERGPDDRRGVA